MHSTRQGRMRAGARNYQRLVALLALPTLLCCLGCPTQAPTGTDNGDTTTPNLDESGNDSLNSATALVLNPSGELTFEGSISNVDDIDVYDLGTLRTGDHIIIEIEAVSGNLDPVAAVFDAREYLVAFNDDRDPSGSDLNPRIDFVLAEEQGTYFLAVIGYPGTPTRGDYEAYVQITPNAGLPTPAGQIVFLDYRGGDGVTIPNVGVFDLPAFSAADVGLPASQTPVLKDRIQQIVADAYAGYDFTLLNSDDDSEPSVPHSTVYFGGYNRRAFAISQQVDSYNKDHTDDTIIFTEGYQGAFTQSNPTLEQLAQAIGNTVAHEVGHLLGLVHTRDCDSLMDTTCSNDRLLRSQSFTVAPLDFSVFPFGYQSAPEILEWVLGLLGL